jgi:hypothetical protein
LEPWVSAKRGKEGVSIDEDQLRSAFVKPDLKHLDGLLKIAKHGINM